MIGRKRDSKWKPHNSNLIILPSFLLNFNKVERSIPVAAVPSALAEQFEDIEQQREASAFGMWVFLITEVMFFGGLFLSYTIYRVIYPAAFADASLHLDVTLGTINTAVLICSSFTMALAVHSAQTGRQRLLPLFLFATLLIGLVFLSIKFIEWSHEIH